MRLRRSARPSSAPPPRSTPSVRRSCARRVVASIGWPRFEIPDVPCSTSSPAAGESPVPGSGPTSAFCVGLEDDECHLVVARADEPLVREEQTCCAAWPVALR